MFWIELKSKVRGLLKERELSNQNIRFNALESLELIIKSKFPTIYYNPDSLLQIDKNEFKVKLSQYKKLNSAESSIVNNFYQILSNTSSPSYNKDKNINTSLNSSLNSSKIKTKNRPEIVESENELNEPIYGLRPVADEKTKILILGTFPAKESIEANFYYQNQIKRFWGQALGSIDLFENKSNEEREKLLLERGIGLWDIFECVERDISNQDKAIIKAKYNNINILLNDYPALKYLVFNGNNAFQWLIKDQPDVFNRKNINTKKLQSSSGGNGHFNQGEDWKKYFDEISK